MAVTICFHYQIVKAIKKRTQARESDYHWNAQRKIKEKHGK